jgi:hypothetical protein
MTPPPRTATVLGWLLLMEGDVTKGILNTGSGYAVGYAARESNPQPAD